MLSAQPPSFIARHARHQFVLGTYAVTIFVSAALLFSVQPLFAKLVLPVLGGSPSVWSIALVFFQAALLGGYVYAHVLTRYVPGRVAVLVHLAVLLAAVSRLPLAIAESHGAPPASGAELWLLGLFAASIGLPFFALSANAPLLQAWFSRSSHPNASDPYFLYAASNVGSFLALLGYPFALEPFTRLGEQRWAWSAGFVTLIVLVAAAGALLPRASSREQAASEAATRGRPALGEVLWWVALGAVPSAYLVAVTAHISTDIASVPLLWVLPLAAYLMSFVIAFQRRPVVSHARATALQPLAGALLVLLLLFPNAIGIFPSILVHLGVFFLAALVCQGELARRRPAARHLTAFYLWMSAGGALGGIFAGLLAPHLFNWLLEYPLLVVAALACRTSPAASSLRPGHWVAALGAVTVAALLMHRFGFPWEMPLRLALALAVVPAVIAFARQPPRLAFALGSVLFLFYANARHAHGTEERPVTVRSFFGVHEIRETSIGEFRIKNLMHGTTLHGTQLIAGNPIETPEGKPLTVAYFGERSPMAQAFAAAHARKQGPIRAAVVGLGAGTTACFMNAADQLDFYEIDQAVVDIATNTEHFTFIDRCKPDARIVVGDARLTLGGAPPAFYDLIVMDAFSSDVVPVHLLTREAMALYVSKLAPGGMITAHVMNRHMDLPPVVAGIAAANGLTTRVMHSGRTDVERVLFSSSAAVMARTDADFGPLASSPKWNVVRPAPGERVWTDDYSNVVGALLAHLRRRPTIANAVGMEGEPRRRRGRQGSWFMDDAPNTLPK